MTTKKYRPYLSVDELTAILSALKARPASSILPLITYLDGYLTDITRGTRSANMETKASFIETLHATNDNPKIGEDKALSAFAKWQNFPESVSPAELNIVQEYRYMKDLMTTEEEIDYETANGLS